MRGAGASDGQVYWNPGFTDGGAWHLFDPAAGDQPSRCSWQQFEVLPPRNSRNGRRLLGGGQAIDELTTNLVQDATKPLDDVQLGPTFRTDARHKLTISGSIQAPWRVYVSPIFRYRSATPIHIWYGNDLNADGVSNDIYTTAYKFTGIDDAGVPSFKEMGPCKTVMCGRGAPLSQLNLRVAKTFRLGGRYAVEGIAEVFNLFNAINPAFTTTGAASYGAFYTGTIANHSPNGVFMKPTAYAGESGQPEQRVGQVGFRITF